jgi:hypothetical protein
MHAEAVKQIGRPIEKQKDKLVGGMHERRKQANSRQTGRQKNRQEDKRA